MTTEPIEQDSRGALSKLALKFVVDPYSSKSFAYRARARRWDMLSARFPDLDAMRVLDLGGRPVVWTSAPVRPKQVVTVNYERHESPEDWITAVQGDACDLPAEVRNDRFDLVYSNSVIEHVGGHDRCLRFCESVHALADAHWVQTPWRYFPLEPHWICPGLQFLPLPLRASVARVWPIGCYREESREDPVGAVLSVQLLSVAEMRRYFPKSTLLYERVAGVLKSIIAVQG